MNKEELRKKIIPILHYCQAYKVDLVAESDEIRKIDVCEKRIINQQKLRKYFYAYYSGLFCRMLYYLEIYPIDQCFIDQCQKLIEKYNWFDLQDPDFQKFTTSSDQNREEYYHSEVPILLDHSIQMPELDEPMHYRIILAGGPDGIAENPTSGGWEYADVRGTICGEWEEKQAN
jgi:hypothetical protein